MRKIFNYLILFILLSASSLSLAANSGNNFTTNANYQPQIGETWSADVRRELYELEDFDLTIKGAFYKYLVFESPLSGQYIPTLQKRNWFPDERATSIKNYCSEKTSIQLELIICISRLVSIELSQPLWKEAIDADPLRTPCATNAQAFFQIMELFNFKNIELGFHKFDFNEDGKKVSHIINKITFINLSQTYVLDIQWAPDVLFPQ